MKAIDRISKQKKKVDHRHKKSSPNNTAQPKTLQIAPISKLDESLERIPYVLYLPPTIFDEETTRIFSMSTSKKSSLVC